MVHKLNHPYTHKKREFDEGSYNKQPEETENGIKVNITYMYNKNKTVHHTNFVNNILKRKEKSVTIYQMKQACVVESTV
jgi:hypothetical protein